MPLLVFLVAVYLASACGDDGGNRVLTVDDIVARLDELGVVCAPDATTLPSDDFAQEAGITDTLVCAADDASETGILVSRFDGRATREHAQEQFARFCETDEIARVSPFELLLLGEANWYLTIEPTSEGRELFARLERAGPERTTC